MTAQKSHASPLVGFNNNVKHRGRIFHIQTEDSGVKHPHVITHLFADGGRIVKSERTDYSEHLENPNREEVLRTLMKEQHKAMFIALRAGRLDKLIGDIFSDAPPSMDAPSSPAQAVASSAQPVASSAGSEPQTSRPASSTAKKKSGRPKKASSRSPSSRGRRGGASPAAAEASKIQKAPRVPSDDFATVKERKSQEPAGTRNPATPLMGSPGGRYAAARPAQIFTSGVNKRSLFGDTPVADQSLDEVILDYLSEELGDGSGD